MNLDQDCSVPQIVADFRILDFPVQLPTPFRRTAGRRQLPGKSLSRRKGSGVFFGELLGDKR